MNMPDRIEVREIIDRLLTGGLTREDASRWAAPRHDDESPDSLVEDALNMLTLIDAWQIDAQGNPTGYLYDFDELATIRESLAATADGEDE